LFEENEKNLNNSNRQDLLGEIRMNRQIINEKMDYIKNNNEKNNINDTVAFSWNRFFLKTGRAIQTYYVKNFTDLFILETNIFND
jgi:hypothetical protein